MRHKERPFNRDKTRSTNRPHMQDIPERPQPMSIIMTRTSHQPPHLLHPHHDRVLLHRFHHNMNITQIRVNLFIRRTPKSLNDTPKTTKFRASFDRIDYQPQAELRIPILKARLPAETMSGRQENLRRPNSTHPHRHQRRQHNPRRVIQNMIKHIISNRPRSRRNHLITSHVSTLRRDHRD